MTSAPIVRLVGLSKAYPSVTGPSIVLEDVDLTIHIGEKVSLVGPSGSGKSTLLSLIAGLLRPDRGSVQIDGISLSDLDDADRAHLRAHRIGIALQSDNLIPFLSARENVQLAMGFATNRKTTNARADALLDQMGVAHRRNHLPRQLSGGEAQRVSLGVALANKPALLLADEMAAQLDNTTAAQVTSEVFAADMAVLFVTHDLELADQAERSYALEDHKLVDR